MVLAGRIDIVYVRARRPADARPRLTGQPEIGTFQRQDGGELPNLELQTMVTVYFYFFVFLLSVVAIRSIKPKKRDRIMG